jgi:4-amino-4-deoxy-L-arabinose transferase-like glycosyltransferase
VRPAWSGVDLRLWREVDRHLPAGSRANGGADNVIAKNPPLYYGLMAIPYRVFVWLPLLKRLFVLRLFNALFYLATIALVWLIAEEVFGRVRWRQALATASVALLPQLAFMSAVINADSLLIALTTGFLLAALRLVRRGPTFPRVLAAGLLSAATILTHGRGVVTLPVLAVALVVAWIKYRPAARETLMLGAVGVAPVGVAVAAYVLFGKPGGSSALYGGQVSELGATAGFKLGQFLSSIWNFYLEKLVALERYGPRWGWRQVFIERFYGGFGAGSITFPKGVLSALRVLTVVGLAGLLAAAIACRHQLRRAWPTVAVTGTLALVTILLLHYVNYRGLLDRAGHGHLFVGRYLLPMCALYGLAIVFTLGALPRRVGPLLGAALLSGEALLCVTAVAVSMFTFYA